MPSFSKDTIEALTFANPTGVTRKFVDDLRTCLSYHHQDKTHRRRTELLNKLEADFFSQLYVYRPEFDEVLSAADGTAAVILTGLAGAGKSTILLKLYDELQLVETGSTVLYLDLRDGTGRLGELATQSSAPVCGWVYERLCKLLIGEDQEKLLSFNLFRIRENENDSFETIRQTIITKYGPKSDVDWLQAVSEPAIVDEIEKRNEFPGDQELIALVNYFNMKLDGDLVLILDNVDRFSAQLQMEVVSKCVDVLATICLPIIAIRSSNLRKIEEDGGTQSPYRVISLTHRQSDSKTGTGPDSAVFKNLNVARDYIDLRISYLENHYRDTGALPEVLETGIENFRNAMQSVFERDHSSIVVSVLDRWNNHSLRHLAEAATSVALDMFRIGAPSTRAIRSSVYRHLVCGSDLVVFHPEHGVVNVFQQPPAGCRLPYPILTILCVLRASVYKDGQSELPEAITFGELRALFAEVGLNANALCDLVNSLSENKLNEGVPILMIHARNGEITLSKPPTKKELEQYDRKIIELMPRGEFLASNFVHTVEYLFWMAIENGMNGTHGLKSEQILSDSFRFMIASQFLRQEVWPNVKRADTYGLRGAPTLSLVLSNRFEEMSPGFVLKSVQSISKFSRHLHRLSRARGKSKLSDQDKEWYRTAKKNVRWLEDNVE